MESRRIDGRSNRWSWARRAAAAMWVSLLLAACGSAGGSGGGQSGGGTGLDGGSVPLPSTPGAQAFVSGLYAFATPTSSCGQCHGTSQVPLFAASDVGFAYRAAKLLVDFNAPGN